MKKKNTRIWGLVPFLLIAALIILCTYRLDDAQLEQGRVQLEQAIRKTAITCYTAEGFYPPTIAYMQEHYGLQWNSRSYVIHYEIFASNLMPDITVLCK